MTNEMIITKIALRRLVIDSRPFYNGLPVPKDEKSVWEFPLLSIETDAGITGYSMGYGTSGQGHGIAQALLDTYAHLILGENALRHEHLWHKIRRKNRHVYDMTDTCQGIIDVALWDIKGKRAGMPIALLLGQVRDAIPTYATGSRNLNTGEAVAEEALARKAEGFGGYKLQLWDGAKKDIPRVRAAREAVGPDFDLMLDSGGRLSYPDALEMGRVMDEANFLWFEEPIPDRNVSQLAKLCTELKTPILAGETVRLDEMPAYLTQNAVDLARADVLIKGGITGMRKAFALCELMGYTIEIHTGGNSLLDVANLHVAAAAEHCRYVESHHSVHRFGLKNSPLELDENHCQRVPSAPGLGIELDWDWLENHTVGHLSAAF
jgi:L-alanine-DL-glutamate epimerase-like enolase superfamily enzyme